MDLAKANNIITEDKAVDMIDEAKRVFLLEPNYVRKFPPIGLMKIASRVRSRGGEVKFGRHYLGEKCDLICCASLFTYESPVVIHALRQAEKLSNGTPMLVGGIYASLMPEHLRARAQSKRLWIMPGFSKVLDQHVPDYSIDWGIDKPMKGTEGGVDYRKYSFVFTSRGCPNKCPYCAVPRIEYQWVNPTWQEHLVKEKEGVVICDNNLTASEHNKEVLKHLAKTKKTVIITSGVDCKYVDEEMAALFGANRFDHSGMRLAFDRIEEDGVFQRAIRRLLEAGIPSGNFLIYTLFNFAETPQEAHYRFRVCKRHLNVRPYPQRYQKLNQTSRTAKPYVGKYWTERLAREFRSFWLRQGLSQYSSFERWCGPTLLSPEDREKWNYQRDKWEKRALDGSDAKVSS